MKKSNLDLPAKSPSKSRTSQIQIVMPQHTNPSGRLFGGVLIQWVDIVASVVARRHSGYEVATACIDSVKFEVGASVGSTVVIEGVVTYVGRTSMEVRVNCFIESYDSESQSVEKTQINSAYLVMVALDEEGNPVPVPPLDISTSEQICEWEAGKNRAEYRKTRRTEHNCILKP